MLCLALQPDFSRQVVLKLKPKILKKIKKIGMIFDQAAKLDKASRDALIQDYGNFCKTF